MNGDGNGLLLTPAQRQQALYQGLLGFGGGVLAGNQPSLTPGGQTPRAIGLGLMGFQRGMGAEEDRALRQGLLGAQFAKARQDAAQQQAIEQWISTLPPDKQAVARANPQAVARETLRPPSAPQVQEFFDPQGRPYKAQFVNGAWVPIGGAKTDTLSPQAVAQRMDIAQASRPQVTVDTRQETEEAKAVGRELGGQYTAIQSAAMAAPGQISRMQRLDQILEQVNTGKFAGTTLELKRAAKAIGIDLEKLGIRDDIAPAQAALALSREMALELRNPQGGAGMPGAMSDKDREFLESMIPGIETDPAGRKLIIESRIRLAKRNQDVARMAREYRQKHRTLEGFAQELAVWSEKNPLFADLKPIAPASAPAAPGALPILKRWKIENGVMIEDK